MENLVTDKKSGLSIKKSIFVVISFLVLDFVFRVIWESLSTSLQSAGINVNNVNTYAHELISIITYSIFIKVYKLIVPNKLKFSNTIKIYKYIFIALIIIGYIFIYDNTLNLFLCKLTTNSWYNEFIKESLDSPIIMIIGAIIVAPIFEEILCRGIILEGLLLRNKPYISIIISSLIFSIMHGNLVQIPNAFFIGVIIGIIYYKTKSLLPCIFAHFTNNFFVTIDYCNPGLYNADKFSIVKLSIGIILFVGSIWVVRNKSNNTN